MRIASIIASMNSGGIGPVCAYAAHELARATDWDVTLVCLHDSGTVESDLANYRCIGLGFEADCARRFLDWLQENPQDVLITSDVNHIETSFPYLPGRTKHIVQLHDSGRRYRAVATNYGPFLDGVLCVARHIEQLVQPELEISGYKGILGTVHNGASFPRLPQRMPVNSGDRIRLLFMGRLDPLKGVADIPRVLRHLKLMGVPVLLRIVGNEGIPGEVEWLRGKIAQAGCADLVEWRGRVPHDECYKLAFDSDVFLMLSRREPFGMVTIEAMSMGCVPIAYDSPSGSAEIIENGVSGFLEPLGNAQRVALRVEEMHADPQLFARLSFAAAQRARSAFSAQIMASSLKLFLERVVSHAQRVPASRKTGFPAQTGAVAEAKLSRYRRLPAGLRMAIRRRVGANARLCNWLLSR